MPKFIVFGIAIDTIRCKVLFPGGKMKNFAGLACAIILVLSFLTPIHSASALDKIDPLIIKKGINSSETIEIFVELEGDTVVDLLTFNKQEAVFSARELMRTDNMLAISSRNRLSNVQDQNIDLALSMAADLKIGMKFQYVFNGYSATVPVSQIEKIASIENVKKIYLVQPVKLARTRARNFLGCEKIWNTIKDPKGRPVDGSGMLVGVTDSGLDYTHPDFGAQQSPVGPKVKVSKDLAYNDGDCQEEENLSSLGHGTACAGIIAADGPQNPVTKVWEKGLAPKAQLAAFKVGFKDRPGLSGTGILASMENNVIEKVDVSNNSYGAPGGWSPYEGAENKCVKAGVVICAAQGNDGSPGPNLPIPCGTTGAPISTISVAALDDTDAAKIEVSEAADSDINGQIYISTIGATGAQFNSIGKPFEVVDCGWGRTVDFIGLDLNGKIALIQRGPSADLKAKFGDPLPFKDKVLNAAAAGAKAVMLYNYTEDPIRAQFYDPVKDDPKKLKFVPTFQMLSYIQASAFAKALHAGHEWELGTPDPKQNKIVVNVKEIGRKGNIASYSSSGPNVYGYLKPDVAGPADETHTTAATCFKNIPFLSSGYWEMFNGTSAASPMVAGCATLIRQGRPEWSPYEVKRALMNTADPLKRFSGDYYLPMIVQGQGRVNAQAAITSNLLFQPASTMILAASRRVNMTDPASELFSEGGLVTVPEDVLASQIPVKITNYNNKDSNVDLSYEVNSAYADQIDVMITTTSVKIPAADKKGAPGAAWFGVTIKYPSDLKGILNDIYIWATDKKLNKKWHIGIAIYKDNPSMQGATASIVRETNIKTRILSPDGDGVNDEIEVQYELTAGNNMYASYDNYMRSLMFYVADQNQEPWTLIRVEPLLELGPHSFKWDGKDMDGNYVLPNGDWSLVSLAPGWNLKGDELVPYVYSDTVNNSNFTIENSKIESPPTVSAHVLPLEPGSGQTFEVGLYLKNAKDIKSLSFKINMPGSSSIVQYMGFEKGDFMLQNEPLTLFNCEYDKDKEQMDVSIQRPLDGISGDGWILRLKFMAKEVNFFDIQFSDLIVSKIDETNKEVKTRAFYKNSEVSILNKAYDPADFNRDDKVDDKDLKILLNSMGSNDGDDRYNWRCDLNFDLKISMDDFALFSKSYSNR
jgi:minor extracellular serine protease Vpr